MAEPQTDPELDIDIAFEELRLIQRRIDEVVSERDGLYAERADLFLALDEAGVTQQSLAEATGIGFQAVYQNIARARARRDST